MNKIQMRPPRIKTILIKTLGVAIPSMLILLVAAFCLMYQIDKSAFLRAINTEITGLIETANIYDGYDYTKTDFFYPRMKEALLSYAERNDRCNTYAAIVNYDGFVNASSKASARTYILQKGEQRGFDYYCENDEVLSWMTNTEGAELDTDKQKGSTIQIIIEDAYLQSNGLLIPGKIRKSLLYYEKDPDTGTWRAHVSDIGSIDFSYLAENVYGVTHIYSSLPDASDYYIILEDAIRGTKADDTVFQYVDDKCMRLDTPDRFGDVAISYQEKLNHGSDSLILFARMNVFEVYASRYLTVFAVILLLSITIFCAVTIILYQSGKKAYDEEIFKSTLLSRLSHDLKTPITAMMGYSENLLYNINSDKKEHYARAIKSNAEYMNEIIQNVMLFSKTESAVFHPEKTSVELVELTKVVWEKYKLLAEEKELSLICNGLCEVNADRTLMQQMLENLVSNALSYATPGSSVIVSGADGIYRVANTSPSALAFDANDLWKPFVKGDKSRSERKGIGIGLSIVRNICELHGFKTSLSFTDNRFEITISNK